jgi:hypothetical protein
MSVMGFQGYLRRIGDPFERHQAGASVLAAGRQQFGEFMGRRVLQLQDAVLRLLAVPGLALLIGIGSAIAQSGDLRAQEQGKPPAANSADAAKDNQRKTDQFVEASQAINGPAGNPECVWLGRRMVRLMWNDDLDTAFRHLDLYDRFGCPGGHIQATFRCLTRFGAEIDSKVPESLDRRVHACWINPNAQPQAAAVAQPVPPSTAGAATAAPASTASPTPAAAPAK